MKGIANSPGGLSSSEALGICRMVGVGGGGEAGLRATDLCSSVRPAILPASSGESLLRFLWGNAHPLLSVHGSHGACVPDPAQ